LFININNKYDYVECTSSWSYLIMLFMSLKGVSLQQQQLPCNSIELIKDSVWLLYTLHHFHYLVKFYDEHFFVLNFWSIFLIIAMSCTVHFMWFWLFFVVLKIWNIEDSVIISHKTFNLKTKICKLTAFRLMHYQSFRF